MLATISAVESEQLTALLNNSQTNDRGRKTGIKVDSNHGPTSDNVPAVVCRDR